MPFSLPKVPRHAPNHHRVICGVACGRGLQEEEHGYSQSRTKVPRKLPLLLHSQAKMPKEMLNKNVVPKPRKRLLAHNTLKMSCDKSLQSLNNSTNKRLNKQ